MTARTLFAGLAVALAAFAGGAHATATITVVNLDGAGEGFNDPTVVAPVGGNTGTTLGQQRLIAFQYAADLWGQLLNSGVTIVVNAQMNPLFCSPTSAVLGSAGTTTVHRDFSGAPVANTWYSQALANSLAGSDLSGNADLSAQFNSNINGSAGCLGGLSWYYGLDANPGSDIDFVTVVLHEIGHGLGFQTFVNQSGQRFNGFNDTYMLNLQRIGASPSSYPAMTDGQRAAANISDPNLVWNGTSVTVEHPNVPVTAGLNSGLMRVHAPNPYQGGSSVSHWSSAVSPNELMEPSYTGANHDVSLALYLMEDIGWSLDVACTPALAAVVDSDTATVSQTASTWELQIEVLNTGPATAFGITAAITDGPPWLFVIDGTCAYGDLAASSTFFGLDSYTLDISSWPPGGPFDVELTISWTDNCGNNYQDVRTVTLEPADLVTGADSGVAFRSRLEQNVPNPFNPTTLISYEVGDDAGVRLVVFDVSGRRVRTLVDRTQSAGRYQAVWDGRDEAGRTVSSGVYFYRLEAGAFTQTRRMVLLK
jgi:hypothetical protein